MQVGNDVAHRQAYLEIDDAGRFLLPGFFDTHVHLIGEGPDLLGQLQRPVSYATLLVPDRMRRTLEAGVTTVRDLGGVDRGFRMAQARASWPARGCRLPSACSP